MRPIAKLSIVHLVCKGLFINLKTEGNRGNFNEK